MQRSVYTRQRENMKTVILALLVLVVVSQQGGLTHRKHNKPVKKKTCPGGIRVFMSEVCLFLTDFIASENFGSENEMQP